ALVFDAGIGGRLAADGPVFMSPKWRDHFKFAVKEADRLGLELSLNLCSGWNAGGPWVKPAQAAKRVVWSETVVQSGKKVEIQLPTPRGLKNNYYRDDAVVAFKVPAHEAIAASKLTASSSYPKYPPSLALDRDPGTRWISNGDKPGQGPTPKSPEFLKWEFPAPFGAASLVITPYSDCGPKDCELQCSDDGKTFRTICKFVVAERKVKTVTFDETKAKAKHFRLVMTSSYPFRGKESWNVQISEIELLKKGQKPVSQTTHCKSRDVVDLTSKVGAAGKLTWDAPAGAWRIVRVGYTLVGRGVVHCTSPGGGGLEIDPLSRKAMDMHFAATAEKCLADIGSLAGKTLKYTHIDSWELGVPNWTDDFRREFKRRRGYAPLPYLPVLAGKIVDSKEVSDRFARDHRRTVADCIAENYYGRLSELSRKHRIGIHPESGGPFFTHWIDALQCLGKSDIPMGEFWSRRTEPSGSIWYRNQFKRCDTVKQAASAAHIYGKKYVQAEAYTTMGPNWEKDPYMLKDIGDLALCSGLTRNMLCFYVHQPDMDIKPGNQWPAAGTHFDRNVTWFPQSGPWMKYLSRCQFMLQQGLFVADVCYYTGENVPAFVPGRDHMKPALPAGYDCDTINTEVLMTRISVKDGRIVLPDGMSYRLLVLPAGDAMSLPVLKKLIELSKAGVAIVGAKPTRTPGLRSYPSCDDEVKKLASKLKLISGKSIQEALAAMGVGADFESKGAALHYIHRRSKTADIYFVSNQQSKSVSAECTFRVAGRQPELWDAITGERRDAVAFKMSGGRTTVPLDFAPRGSLLVVFRKSTRSTKGPAESNYPKLKQVGEIDGPWTVKFDLKWGPFDAAQGKRPGEFEFKTLEDWTKRPEKSIKYYSGKATYHKTFDLPKTEQGSKKRLYVDLKRVRNVAHVRLNGKDLGVVWTAPWRVEITKAVKPTANKLEIDVINLWPNRLIGDAALPAEKRLTKTNVTKFKANSPLLSSGLLGPVTLRSAEQPHDPKK
ncbi:MAG: glycosyl hydrolase, partial [Phycisphaerae bacterium]|nr:glycosyl hydrolase [Phycisphaerae bacterium]